MFPSLGPQRALTPATTICREPSRKLPGFFHANFVKNHQKSQISTEGRVLDALGYASGLIIDWLVYILSNVETISHAARTAMDDDDLSSADESCYLSVDESIDEEEFVIFTCEICIEPMRENNKFNNGDRCSHPFCLDCVAKYIEAKIEENIADLPCPATNCDKLFDPLSCRSIISAGLFEKWCDLLCEFSVVRSRDQSLYTYCPFTECSTLVLNECEGDIVTRTECLNCKKFFCFQCKIPWHEGFDCNETEQLRDENDILFGELVARNKWVKCPGCNFRVEKIEGCPNITCRCKVLFCYTCGKIKNDCVCHGANAAAWVEAYVDHNRRQNGRMNSCFCNFILNLLISALFIGLIVGLSYIKGSKAANISSTVLIYVYNIFVFPCTLYNMGKSCCCPDRR